MAFFQALEGIFSIVVIVSIGYFLTHKGWFNKEVTAFVPKLVNYVALPAFILWSITASFDAKTLMSIIYGITVPFIAMFLTLITGVFVSYAVKVPPKRRGIFCAVFFSSNAVFIGIPVNLALFGEASAPYALLYFFVNSFFFWTAGNYLISKDGNMSGVKMFSAASLKNVFSAPFLGFLFAVLVLFLEIPLPKFSLSTAKYLGYMTTPLSLLFIGAIIYGVRLKDIRLSKDIAAILFGRFIVSPLLILLVAWFIPVPLLMKKVFVIQAALPAMTLVTILAKVHEADAEYSAVLAAVTTLVSALVIPIYMVII